MQPKRWLQINTIYSHTESGPWTNQSQSLQIQGSAFHAENDFMFSLKDKRITKNTGQAVTLTLFFFGNGETHFIPTGRKKRLRYCYKYYYWFQ